jgi:putative phosphoribosyl transferase
MRGYRDRSHAGALLAAAVAARLADRPCPDPLVLGLPRGGVPVAAEVACAIAGELDVLVVRKLGAPGHPELAIGAIDGEGGRVLNHDVIARLGLSAADIERVTALERRELARRVADYRGDREPPRLAGRHVLVVDDGLATGATMRAAVASLRHHGPARVVAAAPVGAPDTVAALSSLADDVVVPLTPVDLRAVGSWYADFSATSDDEVRALLAAAGRRAPG